MPATRLKRRSPRTKLYRLLPVEWFILISISVCTSLSIINDLRWFMPNVESFSFALNHYIGPLFPIFSFFVFMAIFNFERRKYFKEQLFYTMRMSIIIFVSIFIHFNLKLWAPIVNPTRYDNLYYAIDRSIFFWLIEWLESAHKWMPSEFLGMSNPYHGLFVMMFTFSFTLHGIKSRLSSEAVVTAAVLMMVLGAFSYMVAPALGLFVFEPSQHPGVYIAQESMLRFHYAFVSSYGLHYEPAYFTAGLAAMPSLHAANAVMFWLCAWRDIRWLAFLYTPVVFYILVEAVSLKWHYIIDLVAGIVLGWFCYRITYWMVNDRIEKISDQIHQNKEDMALNTTKLNGTSL